MLKAYDGTTITYDNVGNPISDGTWTYTWEHGRQLASMTDGTTTISYTYNAEGMRIGKTVTRSNYSETHKYYYNNGNLSCDIITVVDNGVTTDHSLKISYDESGRPLVVTYDSTSYYYLFNAQGDVMGISTVYGVLKVAYTYDAWGNVLSITGPMADTLGYWNPCRYRGYVYDNETGFYYLQSRYYNPEVGRFINADALVATGQGLLGNNMFAYCGNNPVSRIDPAGNLFWTIVGAIFVVSLVICIPSSENQTPYREQAAKEKYNKDTINFCVDEIGTDPDKLNVTFYPDAGLIHIEDSWSISSEEEKSVIIDEIMDCDYYDSSVYGNSKDTMLKEWSGHNFVYKIASNSNLGYKFFQWRGYEDPVNSTRGVDFRKNLAQAARRNYNLVTLWGMIQW